MEEEELRKKTIAELKVLLQEKGLKTAGKKEELIARLINAKDADSIHISEHGMPESESQNAQVSKQNEGEKAGTNDDEVKHASKVDVVDRNERGQDSAKSAGEVSVSISPKEDPSISETVVKSRGVFNKSNRDRVEVRARRFHANDRRDRDRRDRRNFNSWRENRRDDGKRPRFTPEDRAKRRLERLMMRKGVEPGVELDDEERAKRQKRLERFGNK